MVEVCRRQTYNIAQQEIEEWQMAAVNTTPHASPPKQTKELVIDRTACCAPRKAVVHARRQKPASTRATRKSHPLPRYGLLPPRRCAVRNSRSHQHRCRRPARKANASSSSTHRMSVIFRYQQALHQHARRRTSSRVTPRVQGMPVTVYAATPCCPQPPGWHAHQFIKWQRASFQVVAVCRSLPRATAVSPARRPR